MNCFSYIFIKTLEGRNLGLTFLSNVFFMVCPLKCHLAGLSTQFGLNTINNSDLTRSQSDQIHHITMF